MIKLSAPRNAWLFVLAFSVAAATTIGGGLYLKTPAPAVKEARAGACPAGQVREADADGDADAGRCVRSRHPESRRDFARAGDAWTMKTGIPPQGAIRAALAQKSAMAGAKASVINAGGSWQPHGKGPLIFNDPAYNSVNGSGLANVSGRVDAFDYDPATSRVFALPGNGGLFMSSDFGANWVSIGDTLPTQNNGAVAWTPSNGGTLIVLSGNSDFLGSPAYGGLGAFWSHDLGKTWNQAVGIPDSLYGFELAVDHSHPDIVYAATSRGLFRSTDAGRHWVNAMLPTLPAECVGSTSLGRCQFANVVTSVVVQEPGGMPAAAGGAVLAAVGFQEGNTNKFSNGTALSPGNGLYKSADGAPGSFTKLAVAAANTNSPMGFAPDNRVGRVAMAVAKGADQDHGYVYAMVQDALLMVGGLPAIDVNPTALGAPVGVPVPTVFNGLYISKDFGDSWIRAVDSVGIQNPASGSALAGVQQATGYGPGVQAWYNLWIETDPTVTASGAPARLFFGLEEVWSSLTATIPQNGTDQLGNTINYHVIGAYFAGTDCGGLNLGVIVKLPGCPGRNPPTAVTTTHPDQHGHLVMPDGKGGVYLFAGGDGGAFVQHKDAGGAFDNASWGDGAQDGFNTLLPYDIAVAKDNTVWFGLQDNGSGKVDPVTQKIYETIGGDGFYMAVDPDNSNTAYEEYTNGDISVTTDGGKNWFDMNPSVSNPNFSNPFFMDPTDPKHILTGGSNIVDTVDGPTTCTDPTGQGVPGTITCTWATLFTLPVNADNKQQNITSAFAVYGDNMYAAFCGVCYIFHHGEYGVHAGIATNVGGDKPGKKHSADGWHVASGHGLPNRYINRIAIDPANPKTIYLAIGNYSAEELAPPGSYLDATTNLRSGHVYKSTDAGENFTNVSGNLPDIPALSIALHQGQLLLGTQLGAFISSDTSGSSWAPMGDGLPNVPVTAIVPSPGDPSLIFASTYGRSFWTYKLGSTSSGGGSGTPVTASVERSRFGGGLGLALLLPLGGLALLRRRRRR